MKDIFSSTKLKTVKHINNTSARTGIVRKPFQWSANCNNSGSMYKWLTDILANNFTFRFLAK